MDNNQIQEDLSSLASLVPQRSAESDFAYGDRFELLASSSQQLESLENMCWESYPSDLCFDDWQATFEPVSWGMYMMNSYGLSGSLLVSYIDKSSGKLSSANVVESGSVNFCSAFSNFQTKFPPQDYYLQPSIYFDTYPWMLIAIQDAAVDCDSRRSLSKFQSAHLMRQQESERANNQTSLEKLSSADLRSMEVNSFSHRLSCDFSIYFQSLYQ